MPELPDVEVIKSELETTAVNKKIASVNVLDEGIIDGSGNSFQARLKDQTFKSVSRYGKYIFVKLDREETLLLHFGMTGKLNYYKDEEETAKYARVVFNFKNGYKLAYSNKRKLGKVSLIGKPEDFVKEQGLGPDADAEDFKWEDFKKALEGRRGKIKSVLMNQNIMAGIGNVYSDEILFQAGILPFAKVDKLDEAELKKIYDTMKTVFKKAVKAESKGKFPKEFLKPIRNEGEDCPICGGKIQREKISGRSSYYCRNHQKKKIGNAKG